MRKFGRKGAQVRVGQAVGIVAIALAGCHHGPTPKLAETAMASNETVKTPGSTLVAASIGSGATKAPVAAGKTSESKPLGGKISPTAPSAAVKPTVASPAAKPVASKPVAPGHSAPTPKPAPQPSAPLGHGHVASVTTPVKPTEAKLTGAKPTAAKPAAAKPAAAGTANGPAVTRGPGRGPLYKLYLHPKVGKSYRYRVTLDLPTADKTIRYATEQSLFVYQFSQARYVLVTRLLNVDFGGTPPVGDAAKVKARIDDLKRKVIQESLSENGHLKQISGAETASLGFIEYPLGPIHVGDSWQAPFFRQITSEPCTFKLESVKRVGERLIANIQVTGIKAPGATFTVPPTLQVDMSDGLPCGLNIQFLAQSHGQQARSSVAMTRSDG